MNKVSENVEFLYFRFTFGDGNALGRPLLLVGFVLLTKILSEGLLHPETQKRQESHTMVFPKQSHTAL